MSSPHQRIESMTNVMPSSENVTSLEEAQTVIKQLQEKLRNQSHQFLAWHRKFKIQEDVISRLIKDRNDQLRTLSAQLIVFEAKLHRKQHEIGALLARQHAFIARQQQTIRCLQSRLNDAGLKFDDVDSTNDSDSAVILDDEEFMRSTQDITVARSISDVLQAPSHTAKLATLRRSTCLLRRPEILETVYSVEEDGDTVESERTSSQSESSRIYTKERDRPNIVTACYNRVMTNHRSVTKPKDVKYRRICKTKSKSLEELRGRLKNWVEKTNKFTFSFDQS